MDNNIKFIQDKLIDSLSRLDDATDTLMEEVARSNAVSQLANTYIKACNLVIRVEEGKLNLKNKLGGVSIEEK